MNQQKTEKYNEAITAIKRINDEVYFKNMKEHLNENADELSNQNSKLAKDFMKLKKQVSNIIIEFEDIIENTDDKISGNINDLHEEIKNNLTEVSTEITSTTNKQSAELNKHLNLIQDQLENTQQEILNTIQMSSSRIVDLQEKEFIKYESLPESLSIVEQEQKKLIDFHEELILSNGKMKSEIKLNRWLISILGGVNLSGLLTVIYFMI
ncbi:hypothetical protein [Salisediminibacterium beveridgei]|uniref:Uncharacterized protein n=1 Tax=Salisediminibacterium beveridgei TaxID=632773 RepID=A0A1D7QZM0_9BACI|nr:hypothetical protein [Salisediminibacterium beveridgei]AOM84457.1 hypothetical protein BBEV_3141 [Salisediminibacterium beveridgei]